MARLRSNREPQAIETNAKAAPLELTNKPARPKNNGTHLFRLDGYELFHKLDPLRQQSPFVGLHLPLSLEGSAYTINLFGICFVCRCLAGLAQLIGRPAKLTVRSQHQRHHLLLVNGLPELELEPVDSALECCQSRGQVIMEPSKRINLVLEFAR